MESGETVTLTINLGDEMSFVYEGSPGEYVNISELTSNTGVVFGDIEFDLPFYIETSDMACSTQFYYSGRHLDGDCYGMLSYDPMSTITMFFGWTALDLENVDMNNESGDVKFEYQFDTLLKQYNETINISTAYNVSSFDF